jgi:hypothetical protein
MAGELLMNGQNVPVKIFVGKKKFGTDILTNFTVGEKATMHEDQHLGEKRAKHDKQVDGYNGGVGAHMANNGLLQALIAQQAQRDANQPIDPISIVFQMETRDGGTPKTYALRNVVTKFRFENGARNKRVALNLDYDADDLVPVKA